MNHGPGFQALWQKLRGEVRQLQNKGYYGDGISYAITYLGIPSALFQVTGLLERDWPTLQLFRGKD